MAKQQMQPKKEGHSVFTFNQDYPLGNKKKGDQISLAKVPSHLKEYFDETKGQVKQKQRRQLIGELPDPEKANKKQLLDFLHSNGVPESETAGLQKEDLLPLLSPFYR